MKQDPTTIDNKLMIILFIKHLYNKDIRRRVAGAKNINTLLDAFKMTQWNLHKLKKYEGLVSEDDIIYSIHTVSQISDTSKSSGHFSQPGNVKQPCLQFKMDSPIQPALNILITIIIILTNVQHHILKLAMCVEYLVT